MHQAYKKRAKFKENAIKANELGQNCVKCMQSLVSIDTLIQYYGDDFQKKKKKFTVHIQNWKCGFLILFTVFFQCVDEFKLTLIFLYFFEISWVFW